MLEIRGLRKKKEVIMRNECYLKDYEEMLFKEGKSEKTIRTYVPNVQLFLGYLSEYSSKEELGEIRLKEIEGFINQYRRMGNSRRSINLKLSAILSFTKYLSSQDIIENDFEEAIIQLRVKLPRLSDHKMFSEEEIDKLQKAVYSERNFQHVLMLKLLLLGLKPQIIVDMKISDIIDATASDGKFHLNTVIYRVIESVEDDTQLIKALKELLRHRTFKNTNENYLLISEKKRKYQVAGLRYIIYNYMNKVGISLSDHDLNSFRHFYLKKCFNNSIDAIEVANQISLTSEYVSRIFSKIASTH